MIYLNAVIQFFSPRFGFWDCEFEGKKLLV